MFIKESMTKSRNQDQENLSFSHIMTAYAQLVKFPINDSFCSKFESVEISQKFNFLPTEYDFRKF